MWNAQGAYVCPARAEGRCRVPGRDAVVEPFYFGSPRPSLRRGDACTSTSECDNGLSCSDSVCIARDNLRFPNSDSSYNKSYERERAQDIRHAERHIDATAERPQEQDLQQQSRTDRRRDDNDDEDRNDRRGRDRDRDRGRDRRDEVPDRDPDDGLFATLIKKWFA
jgi:hypothetical protein